MVASMALVFGNLQCAMPNSLQAIKPRQPVPLSLKGLALLLHAVPAHKILCPT